LFFCNDPLPGASYLCVITGDNTGGPKEDAFIEWFYHVPYAGTGVFTGKFTFSASAAYLRHWFGQSNYNGPLGIGIPMFVQPSHNQL
jgi:hypothetical protein